MYRVNRVLVPMDFSAHAADALRHAILLGSQYNAEITLLHVDEFSVSPLGALNVHDEYIDMYQKKKEEFLRGQFNKIIEELKSPAVRLRWQIIPGRAYKVIVEESEKQDYDLIVIATRGLTHLSSHLIGNTTERVVRLSRQPVLSIQQGPSHDRKVNSILCPTDLSPAANVALSYALSFAVQNQARLYIQYISELEKPENEADLRRRMPDLSLHHHQAADVSVEYIFDRDVEPSNSIIRFAQDREIGLIVMSTHGRKGLRRVYVGNTTAEVVRQSSRPVLTVTHPLHKAVFVKPVTEQTRRPLV